MLRVALVGAGYWGPNLARNLAAVGALDLVCDCSEDRATAVSERHAVRATNDFGEVLRDPAISAVVLATPASLHHHLARLALLAGKHVMVEKPLALTTVDADELCQIAQERSLTLMVGHLLEYHPAFRALEDLVRKGELGAISHIRSIRSNLGRIRTVENVLWSFAPHDISLILRLFGTEPRRVHAIGHRLLGTQREDLVLADMLFQDGQSAHVRVGWLEPIKQHQFMVFGSRKVALFDDLLPIEKLRVFDKGFDPDPGGWKLRDGAETVVAYPSDEPMKLELLDFLNACSGRVPPRADGASGVRVVRTLERLSEALSQRSS